MPHNNNVNGNNNSSVDDDDGRLRDSPGDRKRDEESFDISCGFCGTGKAPFAVVMHCNLISKGKSFNILKKKKNCQFTIKSINIDFVNRTHLPPFKFRVFCK